MTRADSKHCGKIPDAREELNRSVREGRIESIHSIKSLEGMGSSSHDLGAELRMHSFTVNCDTLLWSPSITDDDDFLFNVEDTT